MSTTPYLQSNIQFDDINIIMKETHIVQKEAVALSDSTLDSLIPGYDSSKSTTDSFYNSFISYYQHPFFSIITTYRNSCLQNTQNTPIPLPSIWNIVKSSHTITSICLDNVSLSHVYSSSIAKINEESVLDVINCLDTERSNQFKYTCLQYSIKTIRIEIQNTIDIALEEGLNY